MESIFARADLVICASETVAPLGQQRLLPRSYCVRVLIEAERPLGALTVVVQLLKTAMMTIAPSAGMMNLRIGVVEFSF